MVIIPRRERDRLAAEKILYETAGVQTTPDLKTLVWLDKDKYIRWVIGYNNFLGRSVQVHLGSIKGLQTRPRQLLHAAFDFPFNVPFNAPFKVLFKVPFKGPFKVPFKVPFEIPFKIPPLLAFNAPF